MLNTICEICLEVKVDGITCTNTTTQRDPIHGLEHASEWGGLSGEPLRALSNLTLQNGASLVQLYSSLVYRGPNVVKSIVDNL